ncbi:RHS repeat-associated core domain-containing protein, partial [Treponema sp. Marseille-Q4523]|uniref:RHS repeat-associated core domain-containing protein n=1 Tax=Treponema sp. Marseille-Q4523 TaxID=2810610 RepID=UPI00351CA3C9
MSCKAAYDTRYVYGADALGAEGTLDNNFRLRKRRACATYGNRAAKWTMSNSSETLYFNTMWTWHTDKGLRDGQYSKHIYLGETRVVTKQTSKLEASYGQSDEWHHQYYYHPDHLGSAQLITDYEGNEYQRIEYTPYGELWVEKKTENEEGLRYLPYKFTAKEQDEETGLYYYGARYLDAKYSRWLSTDPAVGEYIPQAPISDEAKKHNEKLPGMGGVFNVVNFQLYHYAGNNPVKYTDPDGRETGIPRFDEQNYIKHQVNAVGASLYIAFRQSLSYIGNFFSNFFTGKGDVGLVTSGSAKIGDLSYSCTVTGTVKKGFSIEFDNLNDIGLAALQNVFNESPITLNVDGISVQYKIAKATVSVNS